MKLVNISDSTSQVNGLGRESRNGRMPGVLFEIEG
jgi:hypothetical protein